MPGRDDWNNPETESLARAFLSLESADEVKAFLRDLCTFNEIVELTQRWQIVRLLAAGNSYRAIAERAGVSTATVTRVNQWFQHGMDGYKTALERTTKET